MSAVQVRTYAGKAEEYAAAAANELEAGRCVAATSLAIHVWRSPRPTMLRAAQFGPAYAAAFDEWERSGDAAAWEVVVGDGSA